MDKRINYRIVIDTETCPIDRELKEVSPQNMLTYDCGWAIVDKRGNVYRTRSFIIADVFINEKQRMKSAYYANKIPMYWEQIQSGQRKMVSFKTMRRIFCQDVKEFGVTEVYAHNMRFDIGTLNHTRRYLEGSERVRFFPRRIKHIGDTLQMARDVVVPMPTYKRFCEKYGYLDRFGRPRATAEILYRYISHDVDFVESHTGLEDVMIEKEILAYCFRQHKKMRKFIYE